MFKLCLSPVSIISIQPLLRFIHCNYAFYCCNKPISIQPLLRFIFMQIKKMQIHFQYFNTTLVKVHLKSLAACGMPSTNFNTTLVKVHHVKWITCYVIENNFNTTLVKVHQKRKYCGKRGIHISIQPLLRFIPAKQALAEYGVWEFQYNPC